MSNPLDLEELEKLAKAATGGQWFFKRELGVFVLRIPDLEPVVLASEVRMNDAAFIAAANPSTVLALIARIREAEQKLEWHKYDGAHTCHDECKQPHCVTHRKLRIATEALEDLGEDAGHYLLTFGKPGNDYSLGRSDTYQWVHNKTNEALSALKGVKP